MNKYCLIIITILIIAGCGKGKDDAPGTPVLQDTLLSWTKVNTSIIGTYTTGSNAGKPYELNDVCFANSNNGFLACDNGYLYKTTDGGQSWQKINTMMMTPVNLYLLNANMIFAQGADSVGFSLDGGQTWTARKFTNPSGGGPSNDLRDILFTSASTGFYMTKSEVYKTKDTCKTWQRVVFAGDVGGMFFFDKNNGRLISGGYMLKTIDGGDTWQPLNVFPYQVNLVLPTMQYIDNSTAYAVTNSGVVKTTDDGMNWNIAFNGSTAQGPPVYDIALVSNTIGYACTPHEIFKTSDAGKTWTRSVRVNSATIYEVYFINENTGWVCGSDGTLLKLKL